MAQALYHIKIRRSAEKDMERLPARIFNAMSDAILDLRENPRPNGCKKLSGSDEYRVRVGDYRILYVISDLERVVEVVSAGHRKDIYR
ncbi:MAG: type II toxin-antitoxin system RelE/ParE family toxin [Candidatus Sumerlaeota bacterium]|nr:type II toxin-antitoxin system RelE/ParE family toxin [Candidatus Sumerlaeota bacterium]